MSKSRLRKSATPMVRGSTDPLISTPTIVRPPPLEPTSQASSQQNASPVGMLSAAQVNHSSWRRSSPSDLRSRCAAQTTAPTSRAGTDPSPMTTPTTASQVGTSTDVTSMGGSVPGCVSRNDSVSMAASTQNSRCPARQAATYRRQNRLGRCPSGKT
jgi:hypothetical protein